MRILRWREAHRTREGWPETPSERLREHAPCPAWSRLELRRVLAPGAPRRGRSRSPGCSPRRAVWVARRPPDADAGPATMDARRRAAGDRRAALRRVRGPHRDRAGDAARPRGPRRHRARRGATGRDDLPGPRRGRPATLAPFERTCSTRSRAKADRRRDPGHRAHHRHRGRVGPLAPRARAARRRRRAEPRADRRPVAEDASCALVGAGVARGRRRCSCSPRRSAATPRTIRSLTGIAGRGRDRRRVPAQRDRRRGCGGRSRSARRRPGDARRGRAGSACARTSPRTSSSAELPPAAVKLYGRHLAYAAGFGLADHAVDRAPVRRGGRPPRVEPAGRPLAPGPGALPRASARRVGAAIPALATFARAALGRARRSTCSSGSAAPTATARCSSAPRCSRCRWLWSVWVLVHAVPDLFTTPHRRRDRAALPARARSCSRRATTRRSTGTTSRIDDGTRDRIAAYRVPEALYHARPPGPDRHRGRHAAARATCARDQVRRSSFL